MLSEVVPLWDFIAKDETLRMQLSDLRLAIVCPMANEVETAGRFINLMLEESATLRNVVFIAVLDNACADGELHLLRELAAKEPRLRVVWAPENRCVVDAYERGYREALATGFEWILEIDAGFSHQPEDIHRFFDPMLEGYDCIFGSRFCKGARVSEISLNRYLISRGGSILTNLLLGTRLSDMTSGYQMFQHKALHQVLERGIKSRGHFFQTEIKIYCRKMNIIEVPIHYRLPSNRLTCNAITDAVACLFDLFKQRLVGRL